MKNQTLVAVVIAFLLGVVLSPFFIPTAHAGGDGWTDWQVKQALSLLEKIADK